MFLNSKLPVCPIAGTAGFRQPAPFSSLPWTHGAWASRTASRTARLSRKAYESQSPDGDAFWRLPQPMLRPSGRQAISLASNQHPLTTQQHKGDISIQDLAAFPRHSLSTPQPGSNFAGGELSWQQWLSYFEQSDAAADRKEQLVQELKDAVRQEDYSAASQIKAELNTLEAQDAVASTRGQLDAALAQERYADAAALRDGGLVGLAGWWAGHAEDDPVGHLLHIAPEYSRWTGRVFRPRDIAEMKVQKQDLFSRPPMPSNGSPAKPTGSPILEVFIKRSPEAGAGAEATYIQQAVSLRLPTFEEVEQRRLKSHTPPSPSLLPFGEGLEDPFEQEGYYSTDDPPPRSFGPIVRLNVSIRRDGTARIRPMLPSQPVRSHLSAWEATEAEETLRMLRWSTPGPDSASAPGGGKRYPEAIAVEDDEELLQQQQQQPEIPDDVDVIDISSQNAMSSLDGEEGSSTLVPESGLDFPGRGFLAAPPDDGLEEFYAELMRVPARIEVHSRERMVFHMPQDPAGVPGGGPGRGAASVSSISPVGPTSLLRGAEQLGGGEEGTSSFEVIIPIARMASRQAAGEGAGGLLAAPTDAVAPDTLNILADQVAQSMEAKVGHAAPREEIAEALREVVRRVAAGEPVSSVDVLLGNGRDAIGAILEPVRHLAAPQRQPAATVQVSPAKTTTITYKRIPVDHPTSDPLSGLYLGSFGPHGAELLHLSRTMVDGEEVVQAVKVTGDAHVPAGLVSFRAKVGRKHRLETRNVYPDDLGVSAMYKGEGRVAQLGFTEARWVEGELLVFNPKGKGSSLTGGAELGFVWASPGERRFLILLTRVDLSDVGK